MGVSKNNGTPKSSILIGISIVNHPFWGTPIFGNIHMGNGGCNKKTLSQLGAKWHLFERNPTNTILRKQNALDKLLSLSLISSTFHKCLGFYILQRWIANLIGEFEGILGRSLRSCRLSISDLTMKPCELFRCFQMKNVFPRNLSNRYQKWPYFKPESTFPKAHHFGALQPLVFGDVNLLLCWHQAWRRLPSSTCTCRIEEFPSGEVIICIADI